MLASSGRYTHINGGHGRVPIGAYKIGRVASGEYPGFVTNDVTHDPRVHNHEWAQSLGLVSFAGYRLSSEDNQPIGVLALFSKHTIAPWEEDLIRDLAQTASQVIIRGMAGKAIRESEAKFRSLTENTPDIVFSADLSGTITYVSPKINEIGFLVEEIVGRTLFSLIHPDDRARVREEFTSQLRDRARFDSNFRIPDKFEIIHDFEERSNLVLDEYGNPVEIEGLMWDITDRKNAEDEIRRSLQEKEVLLKEIHHRVKNNLQVVWGLIDLQIQTLKDPNMINTLRDSQNRVRTMALIHETLYRSDDLSHIQISQYLHNLMNTLFSTYSISPDRIQVELNIDDILLDVESAIPCGLIVNELMSNTFKHAFPGGRAGKITIGFHLADAVYTLSFGDNGVGIPVGFDYTNTDSLGLKLVNLLATDQLDGTIQLVREGGTTFIISFPKK
jgi:PAS domain S-box-containing protein